MVESPDEVLASLQEEALIETLAALEHERWSHWQRYLHSQCQPTGDGSLTIPAELVSRWTEQISTPYFKLSEKEKKSDREQVRRYLPVIASALRNRENYGERRRGQKPDPA
jgi:hypothetical protein